MAIDKETADRIEQPVAAEAEHEARLSPAEAIERMRINVPVRGNRKLRTLIERVNEDKQLKGWWHVSNVNAVARMEINDHSWVHIQIVTNIALKLLRQLTKHHVEPAVVTDYGMNRDDAEVVVHFAPPVVILRVRVMELPASEPRRGELFRQLLEYNARDLVHGSYGLEGDHVVLTDTLELENLDFSEFEASFDSITLALASHLATLAPYRER